ncbi:MAG: ATP-binding protein [Salibaculum sp.]|uniref:ATP-binding protein n=1 Tax=Salibaculum sp. TaxID=2855480 RepID=UPI00286FD4C4|nr:ATP-binding protein [Salibaculum sp.]MDR9483431.1 ATP-binding protein [Salibaculum sp.]
MRLVPRSLLGQLALLILGAFLAAQAISIWLFADERGAAIRAAQRFETVERAEAVARALDAAPAESRESILAAVNSRLVRFSTGDAPLVETGRMELPALGGGDIRATEITVSPHDGRPAEPPAAFAWLHERMRAAGVAPVEFRISIPLAGDDWLNVQARFQRPDIQAPPALMGATLLSLSLLMAALWVGLGRITRPLRQLADAADGFGLDAPAPEMPRHGPREVRALSDALGRMHGRLTAMIADRTRMLAALGHDLRSPITALRVRAEMVDDDETREPMAATLDEMQEMVDSTLAYARGVSTDQPMETCDLALLVGELADELSETGPQIAVMSSEPVRAEVRRTAVRRALRNLMENAQRYGSRARVSVTQVGDRAEMLIEDEGPGIPEQDLEKVFDPFTRLETSRSRETGGIGLGLPIARAILRAHGGDVVLSNRAEGGLRATVHL